MSDAYEGGASAKAIDTLANELRPMAKSAEDELGLEEILALPEAKQVIAAWGVKHQVAALARGGKVASWLVGALRRRGLDPRTEDSPDE
jgi:hypothetical protein